MSAKQAILDAVQRMPDAASTDDILSALGVVFGGDETPDDEGAARIGVINRRVEEIVSGKVKGIPAEETFPELNDGQA
jgi:hypothetical protein